MIKPHLSHFILSLGDIGGITLGIVNGYKVYGVKDGTKDCEKGGITG